VIVLGHSDGHVAVPQQAHARMCGQFADAWGNERFGAVRHATEVRLAASEHELGMREWDESPTLDRATGLPTTVNELGVETHLPLRLLGPERLRERSAYAALLASLHHVSFYDEPPVYGLLRRPGRRIHAYLRESGEFQRRLREQVDAPDEEIDRNWRLVRTWDGLSHTLMFDRAPQTHRAVPAADGQVDVRVARRDGAFTLDPWPFGAERVIVTVDGLLLRDTYRDPAALHEGLRAAPEIRLEYELVSK
jgi:Protein of unknown function (DUF3891)